VTDPSKLPREHPSRNRPLLGAMYRPAGTGQPWREVVAAFDVALRTYNELGPRWTYVHEWLVP